MSFGVSFADASAISPAYESGHVWQYEAGDVQQYVPGSWLGYWYDGNDLVEVNAADQETVQEIIDSVQRVEERDANGCPVVDDGEAGDVADDEVSRSAATRRAETSSRASGSSAEDAAAAHAAVDAAPTDRRRQRLRDRRAEYVQLMSPDRQRPAPR